jgi:hypothetical protein
MTDQIKREPIQGRARNEIERAIKSSRRTNGLMYEIGRGMRNRGRNEASECDRANEGRDQVTEASTRDCGGGFTGDGHWYHLSYC